VFIDDMTNARGLPVTNNYGALQTAIKNAIDRVVTDNTDPKASLDQAVQEYETAIGN
jgi:maltose-binding protein MalE